MGKSPMTTLCYVEKNQQYLMLHRVKKKVDVNKDKWIGIGGHFEPGESPEECLLREAKEETGLILTSWQFRGIVTFQAEGWDTEYMCLYTADRFTGELIACEEGTLEWVEKDKLTSLNLWEGDKIFLKLLAEEAPFFSLKLRYSKDRLMEAVLDGKPMELLDIRKKDGSLTGEVRERSIAHENGDLHGTAHVWIVRRKEAENGKEPDIVRKLNVVKGPDVVRELDVVREPEIWEVLLQKRSRNKDSFPGCYDASSAGHIPAGSDYRESALRELEEELGIHAAEEDLKEAFMHLGYAEAEFYGKPFKNAEISMVYVYEKEVDITKLKLQKEEVESVCWMEYETALKEIREEAERESCEKYCIFLDEFEQLGQWLKAQK